MKLNPSKCVFEVMNPGKCVFGVTTGKFLSFMVSQRGTEVNLEKVRAIMELGPPRMAKEVQSLNGKIGPKQVCFQNDGQMSTFLLHSEKIVLVDGRVPEGIRGLKEIPFYSTTA